MAIPTQLFFNVTRSVFVKSVEQPIQIVIPPWFRGDVRNLQVTFCKDEDGDTASVITDLVAVQCGIGVLTNSSTNTPAASSATASTPVANVYPILLPLNLAAIATLLAATTSADLTLEFVLTSATSEQRYQTSVKIQESLLDVAAVDPAPPAIALSTAAAAALYVPKQGVVNMNEIKVSPSGFRFLLTVSDDGIVQTSRIP